jgi:hypothetical protein
MYWRSHQGVRFNLTAPISRTSTGSSQVRSTHGKIRSFPQALALSMDRGPLKDAQSPAHAVVLYILPVYPSQGGLLPAMPAAAPRTVHLPCHCCHRSHAINY